MKAIWFKLMQDSRFYKLKVFYLWLAQVLAFFGLSMVFFSDIMVNRDFEENYARSQSAHLIMTTDAVQPDDAWPLANDPRLPIVEARPMQAGEVQVRPDRFMKALFIGVADIDHPQVNRFFRQDQRAGVQIYIEQNGAYFFDSLYLENLRLVRPNNDTLTLGPAGQVHDTRLPPSRMEHTIYVFLPIARFRTYFPHASSRWLVRTELDPGDPARLRALGQEVQADWMETYAEALRVSVASQEHPHQNIADGIFYLIKLLGSSLGMLGGIFMVLILLTWLYPQIPDMGTLKSLGATRTSIQGAYFLFVFVLGLLAWVPGVSLGYLAAQAFNAFIAFTQNFSPVDTPVSFWQWGTLFGISLAIPLLLSWYPVHSAVRKRVRYAQELVFTTGARAITWLGGRFPTARWSYLSNNMFRNLVLLSLTMLMVVGGLGITFTGFNLISSLEQEMQTLEAEGLFDYALRVDAPLEIPAFQAAFSGKVSAIQPVWVSAIEVYNPLLNVPERWSCARISPDIPVPNSRMIQGQWDPGCSECLYFSQNFAKDMASLKPGDPIQVIQAGDSATWLVYGGLVKFPESSAAILRPTDQVDRWNQLFLKSAQKQDLTQELKAYVAQESGTVPHTWTARLTRQMIQDHLEGSFFVIAALGLTALILSLGGVLVLINLNVLRRRRDIGILKSIGAAPNQIKQLFEQEILLVLGAALLLGIPLAYGLSLSLCFYFGEMVLKFPLSLTANWPFALLTSGLYLLLAFLGMRFLLNRNLRKQTQFLLQ